MPTSDFRFLPKDARPTYNSPTLLYSLLSPTAFKIQYLRKNSHFRMLFKRQNSILGFPYNIVSTGVGKCEIQIQRTEGKTETSAGCLLKIHICSTSNCGEGSELKAEFQIGGAKNRRGVWPINPDTFRRRLITTQHREYQYSGVGISVVIFPLLGFCYKLCCAPRRAAPAGDHEMVPTVISVRSQVVPRNAGTQARRMNEAFTPVNGDEEVQLGIDDDGLTQGQVCGPPPYDLFAPPAYEENFGIAKRKLSFPCPC